MFEAMRKLFQIFWSHEKNDETDNVTRMRSKNIVSVIYTRVIVYGPVDGTNQSNFNLHILQMQKQVGRAARNGIFSPLRDMAGRKRKEKKRKKNDKIFLKRLDIFNFVQISRGRNIKSNLISKFSNYVQKRLVSLL